MTDVELVERAERLGGMLRSVNSTGNCSAHCESCRGARLWHALVGLRGLRLVSPTTGQRQGGDRE